MTQWLGDMMRLLEAHQGSLAGVTVASLACFVGSLLALPWLVARAPVDYFMREHASDDPWFGRVVRNGAGVVLLIVGVAMLVLPGQGLLTILLALSLLDFPGKHALLRRMVGRKSVAKALQWLRAKAHRPPFELPSPREL